ncbi:MAG: response regulator [Methanotrichaceae archaeon]|nr:response regulator [Methanotrichaceae archaeon]
MSPKIPTVLLIEDDRDHADLIMRCFEDLRTAQIRWMEDGEKALDYLLHRGEFAEEETPDLILLDLRIPKYDGHDILQKIKDCEELLTVPRVILTTSDNPMDVRKAYQNHANSYLVKPLGLEEFRDMITELGNYWFKYNVSCR